MQNKTIFLCGLKSSGKTYYAQKLYEELKPNLLWYDSDSQILKLNPGYSSCRELYNQLGEEKFRKREAEAVESLIEELKRQNRNAIVSLGGGVCHANNSLKLISNSGILVYLKETEHVLYERMQQNGLPPYLGKNPKENFHNLYIFRDNSYSCFAKYVINLSEWSQSSVISKLKEFLDH